MALAWLVLKALLTAGVPSSGVSFGGNDPAEAVAPDGLGRADPAVVHGRPRRSSSAARRRHPVQGPIREDHISAGAALPKQPVPPPAGRAHRQRRPRPRSRSAGSIWIRPAAKEYDELICGLVRDQELERLADVPLEMVEAAKADSWWQMLMLHGATAKGGVAGCLL